MPDAPAVAAPAAPSAPAPATAAPVPAPAPVAAPEAAPAAAAPVVADVPRATEGEAALPAAAAPAGPAEPKQEDFPGDVQGFLEAHSAWERGDEPAVEAVPAVEAPKVEEPAKVEEQKAPEPEIEVATPEAFNALIKAKPEREQFLESDPELKNAMFAMARTNAKAAPILEIFPNVESAQFAAETSNTMVNIRTGFLEAIDSPEKFPTVFERFADEFAVKDKDGNAVMDPQGNPQYDEDFHMLNDYIVDTYHDVEIADLTDAIAANQFATPEERDTSEQVLAALKYIKDWKAGKFGMEKPDLSNLSPEAKAYYDRKEAELQAREEALGGKEKKQTAVERTAERSTFEINVAKKVGASVGARIKNLVAEDEKAGVFIPSYVTEARDPKTGISVFAKTLLDKFEEATYGRIDSATGKVIGGVAYIRNQAAMLAKRPPSAEAEAARVDFLNKLVDEHLPAIYAKEKRAIQTREKTDREKRHGKAEVREGMAAVEPRSGTAPSPKALDAQGAMQEAYKWVDMAFPDANPAERTEKALIKKNELMGSRY